jgi:hypothetical protein
MRNLARPLAGAVALAAALSAVAGVATAAARHGHGPARGTAAARVTVPSPSPKPTPAPTDAPASTPELATSSIPATGGPWILFGAGEESREVDAAGWDGRRSGVLHVAPAGYNGEGGIASYDGRHVVDADARVWSADGHFEGNASGTSAWGDDSHTLCGVKAPALPAPASTAPTAVTPLVFFTEPIGGPPAEAGIFTPAGTSGNAYIFACGTADGSIIALVYSERGSTSMAEVVRIHDGAATVLIPPIDVSPDGFLSAEATPDGNTLAYSHNDGRISLMDTRTGRVRTLPLSGSVDALSWNGNRLMAELPLPRTSLMSPTVPGIVLVDTTTGAIVWRSPNHDARDTMILARPHSDDLAVSLNTHGASTGVFPTSILRLVIVHADGRQVVVADNAWLLGPRPL